MSLVCWEWFHWVSYEYSKRFTYIWRLIDSRSTQSVSKATEMHNLIVHSATKVTVKTDDLPLDSLMSHLSSKYCLLKSISSLNIVYKINRMDNYSDWDKVDFEIKSYATSNTYPLISNYQNPFQDYSKEQWSQLLSKVQSFEFDFDQKYHCLGFIKNLIEHGLGSSGNGLKSLSIIKDGSAYSLESILNQMKPILENIETFSLSTSTAFNWPFYSEPTKKISQWIQNLPSLRHLSLCDIKLFENVIDGYLSSPGCIDNRIETLFLTDQSETITNSLVIDLAFKSLKLPQVDKISGIPFLNTDDMIKIFAKKRLRSLGSSYFINYHSLVSECMSVSGIEDLYLDFDVETNKDEIKLPVDTLYSFGYRFSSQKLITYVDMRRVELSKCILKELSVEHCHIKYLTIDYFNTYLHSSLLTLIRSQKQLEQLYIGNPKEFTFFSYTFPYQQYIDCISKHPSLRVVFQFIVFSNNEFDYLLKTLHHLDVFALVVSTNFLYFKSFTEEVKKCYDIYSNFREIYLYRFTRKYTYYPTLIENSSFRYLQWKPLNK
ncbi:hypothetical protein DLAC_08017 [Tieghemostelium lacteum]|uniref:Uncharacterized protein n=1 Tax=Tieghemostelium lacteum TaxID=361077 RepID=A0A151ZAZ7_TIELA|nr:hypothetical protein DLAC_08017 [Tieghemostelium lacteum]|eukprot:KYQ91111.1 hypothetical protein DLAC_08017 [Tieghemostelium lacteum]